MFERYTEKARRVIFFARYEASQFGSPYIETEHLLLGLLREDKALTNRFLRSHASVESIRKQIEGHTTIREKVSTSVDLPLSNECKRVLAYAAEEAERLSHKHIGTEHLLLGLLREEKCFAAEILHERGLRLSTIREELARSSQEKGAAATRPRVFPAERVLPRPYPGRDGHPARSAGRPRAGTGARGADPLPPHQEQSGADRRAGRRQDRHRGRAGAAHRRRRCALIPGRQAHPGARSFADRCRHQVSRPVRRAAQDHHEGTDGVAERHHLYRRAAHPGGRGIGGGFARRRQHPEAGALARRDPVHRRHHPGRISQVDRKGPLARAPLPVGEGSASGRGRCGADPERHQGPLRKVPRRFLHRRGDPVRGVAFQPLHPGPLPAG